MATSEPSWENFFEQEEFSKLVKRRRKLLVQLFLVSMFFFFSVPMISGLFPSFFLIQLFGPINIGLVYLVSQYFIGGLLVYILIKEMRQLDAIVSRLTDSYRHLLPKI